MANYEEDKNSIRTYLKKNPTLDTLINKIENLKSLGEGGTSIVYLGQYGKKSVAVKILALDINDNANDNRLKRFKDEITGLSHLNGKSFITPILYIGTFDIEKKKYMYFVMPEFKTLKQYIKGKQDLNKKDLVNQLIKAVGELHAHSIYHRDLKPQNIFMDGDNLIIGDIGIAWFDPDFYSKLAETNSEERIGNYEFSAPEQAKGADAHPTMDIYAIGQLIQWFANGAVHKGALRKKLAAGDSNLGYLDSIMDKLIANDPKDRFQDIKSVNAAIEEIKRPKILGYEKNARYLFSTLQPFDDILRKSFPLKEKRFNEIKNTRLIKNFFNNLNQEIEKIAPILIHGPGTVELSKTKHLYFSKWLLEYDETIIDRIHVYYDHSIYNSFVVLVCKEDKKTGLSTENDESGEYGFIPFFSELGQYIDRAEYDSGYYHLLGIHRRETPKNMELRVRHFIKNRAIILCAKGGSVNAPENDSLVSDCIKDYPKKKNIEVFAPLTKLSKSSAIIY